MPTLEPTVPIFILMHGLPAAGKSAFARQYAALHRLAHIDSDRIRFELYDDAQFTASENRTVFRLACYAAELLLNQGQSLIFDMSLPAQTMRDEMKKLAQRYGHNFAVIWVQTEKEEALRRATSRDRRRPDDRYSPSIGLQLFEKIASKSGRPNTERETVAVISGQQPFKQQARLADYRLKSLRYLAEQNPLIKGGRFDVSRRRTSTFRVNQHPAR